MAVNHGECREMITSCDEHTVILMVGFQMRFHPVIETVNSLVPKIGQIFHIDFNFGMYRPEIDWRHSLCQGGGALKELGCHLFDLSMMWIGQLESISCENIRVEPGRQTEDHSIACLRFRSGATGYIYCGYEDRREPKICSTIMGRRGQINFTFSPYAPEDAMIRFRGKSGTVFEGIPVKVPQDIDQVYPGHMDSFGKEINHFVECVLEKNEPISGGWEGYNALEAVCAAYESQRSHTKVSLPLSQFNPNRLSECFPTLRQERKGGQVG
jgi:predicted dehydrogenase